MSEKKSLKTGRFLRALLLQRRIRPDKIVVFGSHEKNDFRKDSDIDVVVVSRDLRRLDTFDRVAALRGVHRALVDSTGRPIDLILCSDLEWKSGRSPILNEAKSSGRIVYETGVAAEGSATLRR